MNFAEAMKEMLDGKSVRASNWIDEAYINTDHLIPATLYSLGELLALNWEIYEEPESYENAVKTILREAFEKIKALRDKGEWA